MESLPTSAESLFARRVALESLPIDQALAELVARHPDLEDELRAVHGAYASAVMALDETALGGPPRDILALEGGRYEDRGELGSGGGGEVRLVWDRRLRREMALKTLTWIPGVAGAARLARFLAEARVSGALDHPGVVPVYDLDVDEHGIPYFAMQRVEGKTFRDLADELQARRTSTVQDADGWELPRVLGALVRICETIAYAHSRDVLHRDIKPQNLMVGQYGEAYVLDWGLARARGTDALTEEDGESSASLTLEGEILGTPAYMPPEQAEGAVLELDKRADVYALGAVLYHLLAGRSPYSDKQKGKNAKAVLLYVMEGPPTPLAELAPRAHDALVAIVEKAMGRDREQRYPDAGALAKELRRWLEGRVVRAHRTGVWAEVVKWVGRNRALAGALALVLLSSVIGVLAHLRSTDQRKRIAERTAYGLSIDAAQQAQESRRYGELRRSLLLAPESLRDWEWRVLWHAQEPMAPTLRAATGHGVAGLAWDPATSRLVISDARLGRLVSIGADGVAEPLWTNPNLAGGGMEGWLGEVDWAPDGTHLAVADYADGSVFLLDARDLEREPRDFPARGQGTRQPVRFSPDGAWLAVRGRPDGDPNARAAVELIPIDPSAAPPLRCELGGTAVASVQDFEFQRYRGESGAEVLRLVVADSAGGVHAFDLLEAGDAAPTAQRVAELGAAIDSISADAMGSRVVACTERNEVFVLDVAEPTVRPAPLPLDPPGGAAAVFSPDGARLAVAREWVVEIWSVADASRLLTYIGHEADVQTLAWSEPQRLFSASSDGAVIAWEWEEPPAAGDVAFDARTVAISPDGQLAAAGDFNAIRVRGLGSSPPLGTSESLSTEGSSPVWLGPRRLLFLQRSVIDGSSFTRLMEWTLEGDPVERFRRDGSWVQLLRDPRDSTLLLNKLDDVLVVDPATWTVTHDLDPAVLATAISFPPRSSGLVFEGHERAVLHLRKGATPAVLSRPNSAQSADYGGDSGLDALIIDAAKQLRVQRDHEREPRLRFGLQDANLTDSCWSWDGTRIFATTRDGRLLTIDARSGEILFDPRVGAIAYTVERSPDGRTLVIGTGAGVVALRGHSVSDDEER